MAVLKEIKDRIFCKCVLNFKKKVLLLIQRRLFIANMGID